jgi:RNA polymerase sigma-70 factor (ECF subfamily)
MTFLRAYEHLGNFEGAAKFSTWLTRIAINEGLQRLRGRKPMESLDDTGEDEDDDFRPRQIRAWTESPEQALSRAEIRSVVEQELMRLPEKYRLVVMLRDLEELSTEQTAQALGLGTAVVKTRLLRGRLMLRERLAPRFSVTGEAARRG